MEKFHVALIVLIIFLLLGLSRRKTHPFGVMLLGLLLFFGLFFSWTRSERKWSPNYWSQIPVSLESTPIPPATPMPPVQALIPEASQSEPAAAQPNSKQAIQAYESAISYYTRALALPLKLEKQENIPDKVSTIKISIQDLGQVTVSGSSFLINSIGQTLAKAMTEKMKEKDTALDITQLNAARGNADASVPANPVAGQAESTNIPMKEGDWGGRSFDKAGFVKSATATAAETAKTPSLHSEVSLADVGNNTKALLPSNRPDWVDKPPRRVGDAYQMSVSTEPYTTRLECEARIPNLLQEALNQFLEKSSGRESMGLVKLRADQLRQLVMAEWEEPYQSSVGMMTRIHLLLNFDQKAKGLIDDALHMNIFATRAAVTGTGLVGVWLLLGTIWGYLKMDLNTKGVYRKRLRAAAGLAILVIVVASILVLRFFA